MNHIITKILAHSSVPILSPQDHVTGYSIVEQLENDCQWDKTTLPSYMTVRYADVFKEMKQNDTSLSTFYYSIVYVEAYTDCHQQEHLSRVLYMPFGYWRYNHIGVGNACSEMHWRAYGWNTQKHKDFPTYEHLTMEAVSSYERDAGMVACGFGEQYTEYATFPKDETIRPNVLKDWTVGISWYIYDPLAEKIREQEGFKQRYPISI